MDEDRIHRQLAFLGRDLVAEWLEAGQRAEVPGGTELVRLGQYVRVLPVVLEGLVKVYTRPDERELLLYYIQPAESCVMSFNAVLHGARSRFLARTETDSQLLLLPAERVPGWLHAHPVFNRLFFDLYDQRYADLLDTIGHLLVGRLDQRLLEHLRRLVAVTGEHPVRRSHRELAGELGTAREVVTRTLHRLEADGSVRQEEGGIRLL